MGTSSSPPDFKLLKRVLAVVCLLTLYCHAFYVFNSTIGFTAGAIITLVFQLILYVLVYVKYDLGLQITSRTGRIGMTAGKYLILAFEIMAFLTVEHPPAHDPTFVNAQIAGNPDLLNLSITIASILGIEILLHAIYSIKR